MKCYNCNHKIVLHAFSKGICKICGKELVSPHIPADKLCESCSTLHKNICQSCGKVIIELNDIDIKKEFFNEIGVKLTHLKTGISVVSENVKKEGIYENCDINVIRGYNEKYAKNKLYKMLKDLNIN